MNPILRSIRGRIIDATVTESDFQILFLQTREKKIGPFIREMGDLIAHPEKDRGPILDRLIYHKAQVDLLANKLERLKKPEIIGPDGRCAWWLRHYMLTRWKESHKEVFQKHKIVKSKQEKIIKRQFPSKSRLFPANIKEPLDRRFVDMLQTFSSLINTEGPFTEDDAYRDIKNLLDFLNLDQDELLIQDILMSMLVCVHNAEYSFPNGEKVKLRLHIERMPTTEETSIESAFTPHGHVSLICTNPVVGEHGQETQMAFAFFKSKINTEDYLHDDLLTKDENGRPYFDLNRDLEFRPERPRVRELSI